MSTNTQTEKKNTAPQWTIITAFEDIYAKAKHSELCDEFWEQSESAMTFLKDKLEFTAPQILLLSLLIENGDTLTYRQIATTLACSRLKVLAWVDEMKDLINKQWVINQFGRNENGDSTCGFAIAPDVVGTLVDNEVFVPENLTMENEYQFIEKLKSYMDDALYDKKTPKIVIARWLERYAQANATLPLCKSVLELDDVFLRSFLMLLAYDYATCDFSEQGFSTKEIDGFFPNDSECDWLRASLFDGENPLVAKGIVEYNESKKRFVLTLKARSELLSNYRIKESPSTQQSSSTTQTQSKTQSKSQSDKKRSVACVSMRRHMKIKEKQLFYNAEDQQQIDDLTMLLQQEKFLSVQQRLSDAGMRKGFACLFYGAPGTGKTETVLQLARKTGRNIMQVSVANLIGQYTGESEKNIKNVFSHYKEVCKKFTVAPILLFNEADAIFSRRKQNVERSTDKMYNAVQNIILQELEDLEGILIATTNLTNNLDDAFERRFLFKIEFHKPSDEVKASIWSSMLNVLTPDEAMTLARDYDFSGGQIENIARKRLIDCVLHDTDASFERLKSFCDNECYTTSPTERRPVGFC